MTVKVATDPDAAVTARERSTLRHTLVLGTLIAMGAFGIDTYLPAFPEIAAGLRVTEGQVQLTLVSYFIAMALGQMVYGPLSDRHGRRRPLVVGLVLFTLASVGSALATTIEMLVAMRFLQGLGACAAMVIPRAIVRDLRSGEEAARLFALMLLVLGVSPILAPLVGSLLLVWLPWQAAFWFLTLLGLFGLFVTVFLVEETNPPHRRTSGGIGESFGTYGRLLGDRQFLLTAMIGGFSQAVVFAYLAGSPFVYIDLHHVDPTVFSLLFAMNAIGLIGAAQLNIKLLRRWGVGRLIVGTAMLQSLAALSLVGLISAQVETVPLIAMCLFLCVGAQGLLGPTTAMLSLEPHPEIAGAASALMGTLQFAAGAVSSGMVSWLSDGTAIPLAGVIAGCAMLGLLMATLVARHRRAAAGSAAATISGNEAAMGTT
jgi:MFS transporter, DHA1 family, multidrug resistance protein